MYQHFVNRKDELDFLDDRHGSKKTEFIVIYGRRRIGKTELLLKFLEDKKGIYFLASKEGDPENIKDFAVKVAKFLKYGTFKDTTYSDWFSLFNSMLNNVSFDGAMKKDRIVIVIDEFPFLIHSNNAIPSIFQRIWELLLKQKNIMLILCGSSIGVMETKVIGPKSPLYGRRTGQWKLAPIEFEYLTGFLPEYPKDDLARVWFIIGGTPEYLLKVDSNIPFFENIEAHVLKKGSYLYREAEILLNEEFREPKNYKLIFKAISLGCSTLGEICSHAGLDKSMVSKYLDVLGKLDIVHGEAPVTASRKFKKRHYNIVDPYFNFYFRFIYPNRIDLEALRHKEVLGAVKRQFPEYSGQMFERLAEELIRTKRIAEGISFTKIGRWWHKDREIDIVTLNEATKEIAFFECKWRDLSKTEALKIIRELEEKSRYVRWNGGARKEYFGVIAKRIEGKDTLRRDGYLAFDMRDF
jgi:AAA+ ATPase superfamily predicted ATPase